MVLEASVNLSSLSFDTSSLKDPVVFGHKSACVERLKMMDLAYNFFSLIIYNLAYKYRAHEGQVQIFRCKKVDYSVLNLYNDAYNCLLK